MVDKELLLGNIKLMLGIADNERDSLIYMLIGKAEKDIKMFCNRSFSEEDGDYFPEELESVVEDLVLYRLNRIGAEGVKSETLGSRSVTFTDGLPDDIKVRLYPYRRMRVW